MRSIRSIDLGEASGYIDLKFTLCRDTRQHRKGRHLHAPRTFAGTNFRFMMLLLCSGSKVIRDWLIMGGHMFACME